MEFSGENDQANSAGAYSTGSGLQQQQQEWSNQAPLPDDQTREPDWWSQTHVPSHSGQPVQPSPPMPMQLMNVPCRAEVHSESNVPDHLRDWWKDDQQRQWLHVQPWNNSDPWNQYGIVVSRTGHQQNQSWDQWNRWNTDGWHQWSSWSAGGNDDDWWSSRSQCHSEPKKYFDKSPPPEWDGNHLEKTWRDYRRTLKQWLSTTDVSSENTACFCGER